MQVVVSIAASSSLGASCVLVPASTTVWSGKDSPPRKDCCSPWSHTPRWIRVSCEDSRLRLLVPKIGSEDSAADRPTSRQANQQAGQRVDRARVMVQLVQLARDVQGKAFLPRRPVSRLQHPCLDLIAAVALRASRHRELLLATPSAQTRMANDTNQPAPACPG